MSEERRDLPALPAGWVWTTLSDVAEIVLGQSPPSSTYNENGDGLPFYQGKAEFGPIYPTPEKWCSKPKKMAEEGDVLISVRAPVGPTNICPAESCIGRGLAAIRGRGGIGRLFVLHLMRAFEPVIAGKGTGTTFKAITGDQLREFSVPLPPLTEQQRIVAKIEGLFTRLDAGVAALRATQAQLRRYRQSVLKAAVEGQLTAEWREAHRDELEPASALLERIRVERRAKWEAEQLAKMEARGKPPKDDKWKAKYKEPPAPDTSELAGSAGLPEEWVWATVGQVAEIVLGQSPPSSTYNKKGVGLPFYQGKTEFGPMYPTPHKWCSEPKKIAQKGDVLISVRAPVGPTNICPAKSCIGRGLAAIRGQGGIGSPFLLYFMRAFEAIIAGKGTGTTFKAITGDQLKEFSIPIPPLAEQHQVVQEVERLLSVADEVEKTVERSLRQAERLRQSILKRAFEGRLVPQDPNDESASVLLERIRAD